MVKRKTIQVVPAVKAGLEKIKDDNELKNESKALAYLLAFHRMMKRDLTHEEHKKIMKYIDEAHDQASF